jgi:FKBP-type peptidyl-prolyl cis-trans isomerase FklB
MKKSLGILIAALVILSSCGHKPNLNVKLKTEDDTVSYMMGLYFAKQTKQSDPDKINPDAVAAAFNDLFNNDTAKFTDEQIQKKLNSYFTSLMEKKAKVNKEEGEKFLAENKKKAGVITTPSGLQYIVEKEGNGPLPDSSDKVSVNYTGTLINGKVFDSSVKRGKPEVFPVVGMIPGFSEALLKMKVGSKWKLFIPTELAYGMNVRPGGDIKPNMALIFELEVLGIEPKQKPEEQKQMTMPQPRRK